MGGINRHEEWGDSDWSCPFLALELCVYDHPSKRSNVNSPNTIHTVAGISHKYVCSHTLPHLLHLAGPQRLGLLHALLQYCHLRLYCLYLRGAHGLRRGNLLLQLLQLLLGIGADLRMWGKRVETIRELGLVHG